MTTPLSSPTTTLVARMRAISNRARTVGWAGDYLDLMDEAANEIERLSSPPNVERAFNAFFERACELAGTPPNLDEVLDSDDAAQFKECLSAAIAASTQDTASQPIDMLLYCPRCGLQHVDAPEPLVEFDNRMGTRSGGWTNPPHKSHLCHGCGCIWRPADVPTNGVESIQTIGKADNWKSFELAHPSTDTGDIRAATPKLTREMIQAAAEAHYGKERVRKTSIDGISMTVDSRDYNFTQAFRRMWKGAWSAQESER